LILHSSSGEGGRREGGKEGGKGWLERLFISLPLILHSSSRGGEGGRGGGREGGREGWAVLTEHGQDAAGLAFDQVETILRRK
jgi:hypothetical protein